MKRKQILIQLEDIFGKLFLDKTLLYYEYPRIFVCKSNKKEFYLFREATTDLTKDRWLVTKINKKERKELYNEPNFFPLFLTEDRTFVAGINYGISLADDGYFYAATNEEVKKYTPDLDIELREKLKDIKLKCWS